MKGLKFLFCGVAMVSAMAVAAQSYYDEYPLNINDLAVDGGKLYIATTQYGLEVLDLQSNEVVRFNSSNSNMPADNVLKVAAQNGCVTVGLLDHGLCELRENSANYVLNCGTVSSMTFDRDGLLWFGDFWYLNSWNGTESKVFKSRRWNLGATLIDALAADSKGRIWFAGEMSGFGYYQPGDEEATYLFQWPIVKYVNVDSKDNVWGAIMCDTADDKDVTCIGKYLGEKNFEIVARTDNFARNIKFDAEGNVWYLDGSKIMCYDGKEARTVVEMTEEEPTCFEPTDGIVWIGTKDGLFRYGGAPVERFNLGGSNGIVEAVADAPAEYFDLMGRRVAEPATGMYICRRGTSTSKVLVR